MFRLEFLAFNKLRYWLSMLALYCLPIVVLAQGVTPPPITPTAQSMLQNFAQNIPQLMYFVTALAYVLGMLFIIKGIMELKWQGQSRTMMSREHSLKMPLTYLAVGALLLYLPTSVQIGMSTFWSEPNPYGYQDQSGQWDDFINICYLVIQFIGTIAFIRGLVLLTKSEGHQGGMSKAFTHIIGGLLCINIFQFVEVMQATFGLNQLNLG